MPGFPCVVIGFNQNLGWATSAGGSSRILNPLETGLEPLTLGAAPVVSNTWHAMLESDAPLRFAFGAGEAVLENPLKTFKVWNGPGTTTYTPKEEPMWYAPAEAGAVVDPYPLVVDNYSVPMVPPTAGQMIRFQQRASLAGASAWEHMIAMGLAPSTASVVSDVLPYARYGHGRALNLLVADRFGDLHYSLMAFVPVQGSGVAIASNELDGAEPDERWTGIHPPDEMPNFESSSSGEEIWVACNTSAHFVGPALTQSFPSYILEDTPTGTWRQERADELLRGPASPAIDRALSESFAIDVQDAWIAALWPLFEETYEQRLTGVAEVEALVDFVNENKLEGGTAPFLATPSSRVTVYTTLPHDLYELDILAREDCGTSNPPGCLTVPQKRLGFDPAYERPNRATFGSSGNWIPNLDAMEQALREVATLYVNTTSGAAGGLDNLFYVGTLDSVLTAPLAVNPMPWAALRAQEPLALRWGMVNVLSATPHAVPFDEAAAGCARFFASYLANFYPPLFLPSWPFWTQQRPAVWPLAGVRDSSLFAANSLRHSKAVYPCTGTKSLYFTRLDLGSLAPISVEFPAAGGPPQASFLAALCATSHVRAISEFGIGAEDRWLPTPFFANRDWQTLQMEYAYLDQPANNIYRFTVTRP